MNDISIDKIGSVLESVIQDVQTLRNGLDDVALTIQSIQVELNRIERQRGRYQNKINFYKSRYEKLWKELAKTRGDNERNKKYINLLENLITKIRRVAKAHPDSDIVSLVKTLRAMSDRLEKILEENDDE